MPKDRSSGRRPHSRPPRRARSARGWSFRKNPVFGSVPKVVASFFVTDPQDETRRRRRARTTRRDQTTNRTGTEGQRPGPRNQDTRKQAPGNGRTDKPENQVSFPTFRFDLRGGTLAVLPPSRVSLLLSLAPATMRTQQERASPDTHPVYTTRCKPEPIWYMS